MESLENAESCTNCKGSLARGAITYYSDGAITQVLCDTCDKVRATKQYQSTQRLHTHFILDASSDLYDDIKGFRHFGISAQELLPKVEKYLEELRSKGNEEKILKVQVYISNLKIQIKTKEFESKVWFDGLQKQIRAAKVKGVSAKPWRRDKFVVLTYSIAGRTMITIEDKESSVTLITDETSSESCMGWQGVDATEENALRLIDQAISMWQTGKLKFKDDKKVGII
jgi:hypothetical protein